MIRAAFIGIDQYRDPGIRDLSGASRDATALWALFTDSIPAIQDRLLRDDLATLDSVRQALQDTLGAAESDDLVILTFSGHGTRDHRLVLHDTDKANLTTTTLGMNELAAYFKNSRAKTLLCVIDCCFSGGAPARVLEDSPAPKDPGFPLETLAGKGRIILAASNVAEVAYESPIWRQGILSKVLADVLQEGSGATVDLTAAMAVVMERVRAAAAALGVVQTPVMLGHVEGGFSLPVLHLGDRYRAAFPEVVGVSVSSDIRDLSQFGLPQPILEEWNRRFTGGLNALQLASVNECRILEGKSLLVIAPTSSGKTFIGELAAARAITEGRKAVFLLPYKALVNEKYDSFSSLYGDVLGMRVVRCSGDHTDQVDDFVRGKYDLGLLTCLQGGTAFHNTNLGRDEKQVVERAYRAPDGPLRVLGATTTVAAGINTPASTVIIAEQEFIGEDGREFTIAEYKNMAGRAGRLGFNEKGKAIILADDSYERATIFRKYVRGIPERLASSFVPDALDTWIVRLLAQIRQIPRLEVFRLLGATYGGFLASREHPGWQEQMTVRLETLLARMLSLGLLEQEGDVVRLTLLGRACGQSSLAFSSAMRLVELLRIVGAGASTLDLLALVQALREADNGYTPLMKKGAKESVRVGEASERFGSTVVGLLQRWAEDAYDFWGRCKRAAILSDWVSGVPVTEIERRYSTTPFQGKIGYGEIRRFADASRFHLRSAYHIAAAVFLEFGARGEEVDTLIKRLEVGLPAEALGLLALPIPLERGEYFSLLAKGARTAAEVFQLSDDELSACVGSTKMRAIRRRQRG